jgi:hypothetical protein
VSGRDGSWRGYAQAEAFTWDEWCARLQHLSSLEPCQQAYLHPRLQSQPMTWHVWCSFAGAVAVATSV